MRYSEFAKQFLGVKEGSKEHAKIIDGYNKIRPLPRGYKVKYTDAWCAAFVSFVLHSCGAKNAPYECSCEKMYSYAHINNMLVDKPNVDDIVVYDWNDDKVKDHVGIIAEVDGKKLTVIEGNRNNAVGTRSISMNSKYIKGFIHVSRETLQDTPDYEAIARDVIAGKYGNGAARKTKLTMLGYDYALVQGKVNELLRSR